MAGTGKSRGSQEKSLTPGMLYKKKNEYMAKYYPELTAEELYSEIFPLDGLEKKGDRSKRASNPIFSYKCKNEGRVYFRNEIVFADYFTESIAKTQKNDLALCSMISYSGRRKSAKNGYKCHGFIIDLDGVGMLELDSFWGWVEHLKKIPCPTYVANSGHGLHIYYLFQNPVPLYPAVVQHLQKLKRGLTLWVWNKETSNYPVKERQFQGIYQSFRMVGSRTKLGHGNAKSRYLVKAWRTGRPVSITELNTFVEEEYRCPENPDYSSWDYVDEGHYSLSECKELFPDWYLRRIVNKEPAGQWNCSRGLYDWWLAKIQEPGNPKDGNRYHCISMLYVYAVKCGLAKELVDVDAMDLLDQYNELTHRPDNEFTRDDIIAASQFYDTKYVKMSRQEISRRTGIRIEPCRRNYRSTDEHMKIASFIRDMKYPDGTWRNKDGRPMKQDIVAAWQLAHPDGKKIDCERETGLSRHTVLKWWQN